MNKILSDYKNELENLDAGDALARRDYLKGIADGKILGPQTGYASIDKPWLKWYDERFINLDFERTNTFDFFLNYTAKFGNSPILNYYGRKFSREDIKREVEDNIKRFQTMGLKAGDTVSLVMLNTPEVLFIWYALSKMGVTTNMIKFDESPDRIQYMVDLTKSKYLFVSNAPFILKNVLEVAKKDENLKNVYIVDLFESLNTEQKKNMVIKDAFVKKEIAQKKGEEAPSVEEIVAFQINVAQDTAKLTADILATNPKFRTYKEWKNMEVVDMPLDDSIDLSDYTSAIVYTGGTTGDPKGVQLTNNNLNCMVHALHYGEYEFDYGKKSLNVLPPAIAYYFNATHGNMSLGVEVSLVSNFTVEQYPYLIKEYQPNIFMSGPILLENIRKANILDDTSFMVAPISGGDKLSNEEEKEFDEYIKAHGGTATVHQGYGMSECTAAATYSKSNAREVGSIGIPFFNIDVAIFDFDTCEELPYGTIGEICISGPTVMKGYFDNETATKGTLRTHKDGKVWLHTDDLGFMTNEGKVFHRGRAKRMLTRSGAKVWTSIVEDLVSENPLVDKCSCVKMNDEVEREVPVIHIVLKNENCDKEALVSELTDTIGKRINPVSIPKYFIFKTELPYSEVNKKCDYRRLEAENIFDTEEFTIKGNIVTKNNGIKLQREK